LFETEIKSYKLTYMYSHIIACGLDQYHPYSCVALVVYRHNLNLSFSCVNAFWKYKRGDQSITRIIWYSVNSNLFKAKNNVDLIRTYAQVWIHEYWVTFLCVKIASYLIEISTFLVQRNNWIGFISKSLYLLSGCSKSISQIPLVKRK